jgi:thioredoxin 1
MASPDTKILSDASFKAEVLDSQVPVLVDFFAEWCGPCKAMAPALDQVATDMKGKVTIAKIDVDANPEATQTYGIQAMPTLLIFKGGKIVARKMGALTQKRQIEEWINSSI